MDTTCIYVHIISDHGEIFLEDEIIAKIEWKEDGTMIFYVREANIYIFELWYLGLIQLSSHTGNALEESIKC